MKLVVTKKHILMFKLLLLWVVLFPANILSYVPELRYVKLLINAIWIASAIYIIIDAFVRKYVLSDLFGCFFLIFAYYLVNTILHDDFDSVSQVVRIYVSILLLVLVIDKYLISEKQLLIKSFYVFFSAMIYINAIVLLVFPDGVAQVPQVRYGGIYTYTRGNFLASDNRLIMWDILALLFVELYATKNIMKRLNDIAIYIVVILQTLYIWSATGIIAIAFFIIMDIMRKARITWRLSINGTNTLFVLASIGMIVFHLQEHFARLITEILDKSVSLSNRTLIWDKAIQMISKEPIFGYGYANNGLVIDAANGLWYSHNLLLDLMIQGGAVLLLLFLILSQIIYKNTKSALSEKNVQIIMIAYATFLVTATVESYLGNIQFFLCIVLLYYAKRFV